MLKESYYNKNFLKIFLLFYENIDLNSIYNSSNLKIEFKYQNRMR